MLTFDAGGAEALNLLLVDYAMPGISGAEVIRAAKRTRPDLPAGWSEVVRKLLAKRPDDRYQNSEPVIAALLPLPVE